MKAKFKILIVISSLLLILSYFFPIWSITLDAPQYPEGLGMKIWINDIRGEKEFDLKNINGLNHYIGMKVIEPESITELKLMPYIIGILICLGLVAGITGKRWLLYIWILFFFIVSVVGLVDFYLWEYDYGHNLDLEHASIKIPGMTYQPPLIGSKQLLNFTATSMPDIAGWIIFGVFFIGVAVAVITFLNRRKEKVGLNDK
jgi:copper chaperone NosL